jgi:hypothetical protein
MRITDREYVKQKISKKGYKNVEKRGIRIKNETKAKAEFKKRKNSKHLKKIITFSNRDEN